MHVSHTAIWVSDLEAATSFYEDVLGLEYQWEFTDDGVLNYYVGTGDSAQIQLKHDPDDDGIVEPSGMAHLALGVDDVDRTFERVVDAADPPVVLEPTDFEGADRRAAFVEDPDGYVVELVGPM